MTREEIINIPELVDFMLDESVIADSREKLRKRLEEVCNLAIKALEQESCGDAISREDTMTALRADPSFICPGDQMNALRIVEDMPPVNPQPKTGLWIWCVGAYKCSNCGEYVYTRHNELLRYCPYCGTTMIEPQESEDEE